MAWQVACMGGACMTGGMYGRGACMAGGMHGGGAGGAWQERRPLQRPVHIILECILVISSFCHVSKINKSASSLPHN